MSLFHLLVAHILYHGSLTDRIEILEPRLRYTPGEKSNSPAGIYASDLGAFAAAHSFPWSSDEGIDLYVDDQEVILEVPQDLVERLRVPIYIYEVDDEKFILLECESTGHTYRAIEQVDCLNKYAFKSVIEAIEHYNGHVIIKD